ncbi:EthD family reductase [Ktedonosporobacter rubrisoli]|uniref:EthD family reductase n=1 Tax=Ktedonosporobacter rubrisoli TaxID=2509675 RepID=A0A4P6JJ76_KTERU|nr:EthD family reductase [Ktedonosporobacter rubrisoli]QBD75155.1 EthD family reductase [Ktedonosporobacter rubrisoli]
MVKFLVLWNTPADPVAFERHYREVHIPLVRQLPSLRRYTAGCHATALRGEPYYWIAEAEWDTMEALQKAFQSPQGQAVSQDVANLAHHAQVRSMVYEVEELESAHD